MYLLFASCFYVCFFALFLPLFVMDVNNFHEFLYGVLFIQFILRHETWDIWSFIKFKLRSQTSECFSFLMSLRMETGGNFSEANFCCGGYIIICFGFLYKLQYELVFLRTILEAFTLPHFLILNFLDFLFLIFPRFLCSRFLKLYLQINNFTLLIHFLNSTTKKIIIINSLSIK